MAWLGPSSARDGEMDGEVIMGGPGRGDEMDGEWGMVNGEWRIETSASLLLTMHIFVNSVLASRFGATSLQHLHHDCRPTLMCWE